MQRNREVVLALLVATSFVQLAIAAEATIGRPPTIDWTQVIIQLFVGLPAIIAAFAAWQAAKSSRAETKTVAAKVDLVDEKVQAVKVATDGMKSELVKVTADKNKLEGREEGRTEGVQSEKDRHQENGTARIQQTTVAPPPQVVVVQMPAVPVVAPAAGGATEVGKVHASTAIPDMSIKAQETKVDAKGATIIIDGGISKPEDKK